MKLDSKTDVNRPSLSGKDVFDEVFETLSERTPLYENFADITLPADNTDLDALCRLVIRNLETSDK
jgi:shikimate kinase